MDDKQVLRAGLIQALRNQKTGLEIPNIEIRLSYSLLGSDCDQRGAGSRKLGQYLTTETAKFGIVRDQLNIHELVLRALSLPLPKRFRGSSQVPTFLG